MRTGQEMARKENRRCLSLAGVDQATAFRLRACHSHGDHRDHRESTELWSAMACGGILAPPLVN